MFFYQTSVESRWLFTNCIPKLTNLCSTASPLLSLCCCHCLIVGYAAALYLIWRPWHLQRYLVMFPNVLLHPVPFWVLLTPAYVAILGALYGLTPAYLLAPLLIAHRVYSTPKPALQTITLVSLFPSTNPSCKTTISHIPATMGRTPASITIPQLSAKSWEHPDTRRPAQHFLKTLWQIKPEWSVFTV